MPTLTYLKGKINNLKELVTLPRYWGPVATVAFTVLYHLGSMAFGYSPAVAPLTIFLAIGSITGLRSGLICAAWVSGYAYYAIDDTSRVIQIVIGVFGIAAIVGLQTRALRKAVIEAKAEHTRADLNQQKADIVDSVNGNVQLALKAIDLLDSLRFAWDAIADSERLRMVEQARAKLADLVTLARGFRQMAKERGFVLDMDDNEKET